MGAGRRAARVEPAVVGVMVDLEGVPPAAPIGKGGVATVLGTGLGLLAVGVLGGLLANASYQFVRIVRSILRGDIIL